MLKSYFHNFFAFVKAIFIKLPKIICPWSNKSEIIDSLTNIGLVGALPVQLILYLYRYGLVSLYQYMFLIFKF